MQRATGSSAEGGGRGGSGLGTRVHLWRIHVDIWQNQYKKKKKKKNSHSWAGPIEPEQDTE